MGVGVGAGAGAGFCLDLEPEISKMGGSGNPGFLSRIFLRIFERILCVVRADFVVKKKKKIWGKINKFLT